MEPERWQTQSEGTDGFLETPALEVAAQSLARSAAAAGGNGTASLCSLPAAIGRYRIVRLLGEGGMGTVYEAEQEQPRRFVALKVIRPGLATPERLRRFTHEAQALGRLQHPGIAQIYEASTADTGFGPQPYFAMELIRGQALQQYAAAHRLDTRQRLGLMVKICEAVHHAHQRGVIHRDLKPGNIVVDEAGQPKILDFGVARVTESDAQATRQTDLGQIVGTLAYMSPEQVLADPLEVDTRSDVYSLGVILYELLSGRLPYEVNRRQLHEAVQTIREEDPTSLSSISRHYRGDVETIVGKALEKDKARRYSSAADLAADMQRYLSDEPITARPPSASYQLQKFARRHRALVAGVTAVFVALLAGVAASTSQAIRANREGHAALVQRDRAVAAEARAVQERNRALAEKQRADEESATAKAVDDFLRNDLLAQAGARAQARPDTNPDPDLKVRTALDRAAAAITGKFNGRPLVEASIRQTIGRTYLDLGIYPQAQEQMERAIDLRRRALGDEHPDTLQSTNNLAELYWAQGKYGQAEPLFDKCVELRRRALGEDHPDTLECMNGLGWLYRMQGRYAQAEALLTKVLETRRRILGEDHPGTLDTMNNLAVLYRSQDEYAKAEPLYSRLLKTEIRILGEEHPDTLVSMNNLAVLYRMESKYAEAEPLQTRALEIQRRVRGDEHPDTLVSMNNLAALYRAQGKYAEAEPLQARVLEIQRRALGEEHPFTLAIMTNMAALYRAEGKYAEAEATMASVIEIERRKLGAQNPETTDAIAWLAGVQLQEQKYLLAEPLVREALSNWEKMNPDGWKRYYGQVLVGASLAGQKRYADAEPLLVSGYQGMIQREAAIPPESRRVVTQAGERIVQLYQNWRKPEKAAEWGAKLPRGAQIH